MPTTHCGVVEIGQAGPLHSMTSGYAYHLKTSFPFPANKVYWCDLMYVKINTEELGILHILSPLIFKLESFFIIAIVEKISHFLERSNSSTYTHYSIPPWVLSYFSVNYPPSGLYCQWHPFYFFHFFFQHLSPSIYYKKQANKQILFFTDP